MSWRQEVEILESFRRRLKDAEQRGDVEEYARLLQERNKWLASLNETIAKAMKK